MTGAVPPEALVDPDRAADAGAAVAVDLIAGRPDQGNSPSAADAGAAGPQVLADLEDGCPCGCGERELLLRARAGDDAAVGELLSRYRKLARGKARSYFVVGADRDDVVQEAMIGLYAAIRDFDDARGVSFRSFAEVCVTRQVVTAVRAATRRKHGPLSQSVSLDQPVDGEDGTSLADLLPAASSADPAAAVVSADELRALQRHLDEVLSDLEQQVLRHHLEGKGYDEIAGALQRHVKAVDNALQRVKRKLLGHLDAREAALP